MSHSFATADLRLLESEVPDKCPICNSNVTKGIYYVECNNIDDCEWHADIIEEPEPERPDNYDWVLNK